MNGFDYTIIATGVLAVVIAIFQLTTKKCVGIMNIDIYTDESASKFAFVSGIIYLFGGILTATAPFIANYINTHDFGIDLSQETSCFVLLIVLAAILVSQFTILKKKNI
ncbi:MAG: hypothetical protein ACI4GX_09305 [Ruminococcus sp.]